MPRGTGQGVQQSVDNPRKLKRAVIKEELVALTGDFVKAVLLNQLIYWTERAADIDAYIREERQRVEEELKHGGEVPQCVVQETHGWIYKSAEELNEETMLGLSRQTIRRHLQELIDRGYVSERTDPRYRWSKTMQYRVNLARIQEELTKLGYCLDGYSLVPELAEAGGFQDQAAGKESPAHARTSTVDVRCSILDVRTSNLDARCSKMDARALKNGRVISEITSEIITETTTKNCKTECPPVNVRNSEPDKLSQGCGRSVCASSCSCGPGECYPDDGSANVDGMSEVSAIIKNLRESLLSKRPVVADPPWQVFEDG
ncbi:MAG: winged helix-turn-helix domain-containing protein [Bacillota bacterium]